MSPFRIPSPALIGLACFGSGVLAGLSGGWVAGVILAGALGAAACDRRIRIGAAVFGLGAGHGFLARWHDDQGCSARLPAGPAVLTGKLDEPAVPGQPARFRPAAACRGSITIRLGEAGDTLWAGELVRLEGRWIPSGRGLGPARGILAVRAATVVSSHVKGSAGLRNWLVATIARLYGPRAGVIRALILGSRGTIDPVLSGSFARSGLVHLLSISGFHVGLIWAWVILLVRLAGRSRVAEAVAALVVVGYVGFIGAPAPALRATVLAVVAAVERRRQRAPASGPLFAVVLGAVVAFDPFAVVDLGAWLSGLALWGATAASAWSDRAVGPKPLWRVMAASTGATVATAPVTAFALGTVALIGIGLNIVAIPLTALAVPAVVMSLVASPVAPAVASAFAAAGGGLLAGLEFLADWGAAVPGGALSFEAGLGPAVAAASVVVWAAWSFGTRHRLAEAAGRVGLGLALFAIGHAVVSWPEPHVGSRLTLHFLNVGQGDAALLETPHGHWVLIDAGPADGRVDAGQRVILPFLRQRGVRRLDAMILSHAHRDHVGGVAAVLGAVQVDRVFEPAVLTAEPSYGDLLDQLVAVGAAWRPLRAGDRIEVDGVTLDVVHPTAGWRQWGEDLNEDSVVFVVRSGPFAAAFPGDAGLPVEERIGAAIGPVDVLKVGHHGSRTATGPPWLLRLTPRVAIVSSGVNRYGHPAPETLGRLSASGASVWRTDTEGTVTVEVGDSAMRVRGRGRAANFPIF